jgi:hypothetical protein
MGKTKRFNALLKTWGNLVLISPEAGASKFMRETSVNSLHLAEFGKTTHRSTGIRCVIVLERNTVEKKNNLLGQIGNIAAGLTAI